jgi:hypothetical protein
VPCLSALSVNTMSGLSSSLKTGSFLATSAVVAVWAPTLDTLCKRVHTLHLACALVVN